MSARPKDPHYMPRGGWYVCAHAGFAYPSHYYSRGECLRCGAAQQEEMHWEARWRASVPVEM